MAYFVHILNTFWRAHPALLYACIALVGCYAATDRNPWLIFPLFILFAPLLRQFKCLILSVLLLLLFFFYTLSYYQFPNLEEQWLDGTAQLDISSLQYSTTHFGKRWLYKGKMKFKDNNETVFYVPYALSINDKENLQRPLANQSYEVKGKLKKAGQNYTFSVKNDTPWHPIEGTWSLAEKRYTVKSNLTHYLHKHMESPQAATFLAGIATGDFDDRLMINEFSRFGLQHIMAISGFHFAIVAGILSLFIRYLLPQRYTILVMMGLLSAYFLFLGFGSSIMRAWLTVSFALIGSLIEKQNTGLNSLGLAVLVILVYDPWLCQNLGFQFSVLTTASILLFYSIANSGLQPILSKRSLYELLQMDILNRHAYVGITILREALALGIAVNMAAFPMTLFFFHKFPWLSLIYNLFFPFMVSVSMLFLILGLVASLLFAPLADVIHYVNNAYTQFVLNFTFQLPNTFDVYLRLNNFSVEWMIVYIPLLVCTGIYLKHRLENDTNPQLI